MSMAPATIFWRLALTTFRTESISRSTSAVEAEAAGLEAGFACAPAAGAMEASSATTVMWCNEMRISAETLREGDEPNWPLGDSAAIGLSGNARSAARRWPAGAARGDYDFFLVGRVAPLRSESSI